MDKTIWIIMVALAGAVLPLQAGLNNKMAKGVGSPLWASMISFTVGSLVLLIYLLITKNNFQVSNLRLVPSYTWLAGLCGAFYVTVVLLAFPKLGPALTFGIVVGGQLIISLLMDHYNVLVQEQHSINIYRVIGILMIIGGVVLIRKY